MLRVVAPLALVDVAIRPPQDATSRSAPRRARHRGYSLPSAHTQMPCPDCTSPSHSPARMQMVLSKSAQDASDLHAASKDRTCMLLPQ